MSQLEIDNTDWGKLNDNGDPDYPTFEDFVEKKMFDWVKKNGGTVTERGEQDCSIGRRLQKISIRV